MDLRNRALWPPPIAIRPGKPVSCFVGESCCDALGGFSPDALMGSQVARVKGGALALATLCR